MSRPNAGMRISIRCNQNQYQRHTLRIISPDYGYTLYIVVWGDGQLSASSYSDATDTDGNRINVYTTGYMALACLAEVLGYRSGLPDEDCEAFKQARQCLADLPALMRQREAA